MGQAGDRLLLGSWTPGTSIHLHSLLLVSGPEESDFLGQAVLWKDVMDVMMNNDGDEFFPESWKESELEKLTAGHELC